MHMHTIRVALLAIRMQRRLKDVGQDRLAPGMLHESL
jgi:hypothetical protein